MPIFYLDLENGNDANDGLSFANRWRTFALGATAARIAPGDIIRVMGSPNPTSLGQVAQWTSAKTPATFSPSLTGTSNTTPIVVTRNAHGLSNGNTVVITGHTTNTNANGTWTIANVTTNTFELVGSVGNGAGPAIGALINKTNAVVTLTSAVTQSIASTANVRSAWTASANVTATLSTLGMKVGSQSDQIAVSAAFTTGLAAYFPTGTLNLSGFRQVSFWIAQTAGTIGAAASISLRLCSDALGATAVNVIDIPALGAINQWQCVTVNTGAALGSSIQSIGFVVNTDNGAQTFLLSNIIACKASSEPDSLTLSSLIGKNDGQWWGIQSIDGTRVMLDGPVNTFPSGTPGYYGTTESVTVWKREPTIIGNPAATTNTGIHAVQDSGTAGSPIVFSGGWNRVDMSTQDGETWLDGRNGLGNVIVFSNRTFCSIERFGFVRSNQTFESSNAAGLVVNNCYSTCNSSSIPVNGVGSQISNCVALCSSTGMSVTGARTIADGLTVLSSTNLGVSLNAPDLRLSNSTVHNSITSGITFVANLNYRLSNIAIHDGTAIGLSIPAGSEVFGTEIDLRRNAQGINGGCAKDGCVLTGSSNGNATLWTGVAGAICCLKDWVSTSDTTFANASSSTNTQLYFDRFNNTNDDHRIFFEAGSIVTATDQRNTAADFSWKCVITSATLRPSTYPVVISLGRYRVLANVQATATLWVRRDHVNAFVALFCCGGQLPGVGSVGTDVTATISAAVNTWQQLTINFTPTQAGVIELSAMFYATVANQATWIDDLVFSQAGLPTITNGLNVVSNGRIINPGSSISNKFRQVNINGGADQ